MMSKYFKTCLLLVILVVEFQFSNICYADGECTVDLGGTVTCPQFDGETKVIWVTDYGTKSDITVTVGECDNQGGESATGFAFINLTEKACWWDSCGENSIYGGNIMAVCSVSGGTEEQFKEFVPNGFSFTAGVNNAITINRPDCKKSLGLVWTMQPFVRLDFQAHNGKTTAKNIKFNITVDFYEFGYTQFPYSKFTKYIKTANTTVTIVPNKCSNRNGFLFKPEVTAGGSPGWVDGIYRAYADIATPPQTEWKNTYSYSWWDSQDVCHTDSDVEWFYDSLYASGTQGPAGYYCRAKVPTWEKDVSISLGLPQYMTEEGWNAYYNIDTPNNSYISQSLGTQGTMFYNCSAGSGSKRNITSVEYCPSGTQHGSGTTLWRFEYNQLGQVTSIYNGSSLNNSSYVYLYQWSAGSNNSSTAAITYYENGINSTPISQSQISFDANGRELANTAVGCTGGCQGGEDYHSQEYYASSERRLDGLVKIQRNAANDIVMYNVYDGNSIIDANLGYQPTPFLKRQYAVKSPSSQNPETMLFKDFVYDVNAKTITEYQYVTNSQTRCTKRFYADSIFTILTREVQYANLTSPFVIPSGDSYSTYYSFDANTLTRTVTFPSNKRKDISILDSQSLVSKSLSHDVENDVNSNVNEYTYSGYDVYQHTDPRGAVTTYNYSYNQVSTQYNPLVNSQRQEIHNSFDTAHRVYQSWTKDTNGNAVYTLYSYNNTTGLLDSLTEDSGGANEAVTIYRYDSLGRLTRKKTPEGTVTGTHYNLAGQTESEFVLADANSIDNDDSSLVLVSQIKYTYDADGHTRTIRKAKDNGAFDFNDPDGWIITQNDYDFLGRRIRVIEDACSAYPLVTLYEYDNQGQQIKETYPSGKWVETVRDGRGLVHQTVVGYENTSVLTTISEYDDNGNLIQQSNPDGTIDYYEYDNFDRQKSHRRQSSMYPCMGYEFDSAGSIIREIAYDANGAKLSEVRKDYDILGRVWRQRALDLPNYPDDANDRITLYQFDVAGNSFKTIQKGLGSHDANNFNEPNDIIIESHYDSLNRRTHTINAMGQTTSYSYDKDGNLLTTTDPNNFTTTNTYQYGWLNQTTDAQGNYKQMLYNSLGQVFKVTAFDCNGTPTNTNNDFKVEQTRYEYSNFGRLTQKALMKDPASTATTTVDVAVDMVTDYEFDDANGLLNKEKKYFNGSSTAAETVYTYDRIERKIKVTDPELNEQRFYYQNSSCPAQLTKQEQLLYNSSGSILVSTVLNYDSLGRPYTTTVDRASPHDDIVTTYYYDDLGRRKTIIDPNNVQTGFNYDAFGNQIRKIEAVGRENRITDYGFDRLGRPSSITGYDPNAQITRYEYNKNGNETKIIYPDGTFIGYSYNLIGKVDEEVRRDGSSVHYSYDKVGKPIGESFVTETISTYVSNEYDAAGRMLWTQKTIDSQIVSESEFAYNGFGFKTSETTTYDDDGDTTAAITYTCDQQGLVSSQHDSLTGTTFYYAHDGLGRIKTIDKGNDRIATYTYMGPSTKSITYDAADVTSTNNFDDIGRLEQITSTQDSSTLLDFIYTYDIVSNRTSVQYNHLGSVYDRYTYDSLRRLLTTEYGESSGWSLNGKQKFDIDVLADVTLAWLNSDKVDFDMLYIRGISQNKPKTSPLDEAKVKLQALKDLKGNAPIFALTETAEGYRVETLTDENGNTTGEIIYDGSDRIMSFSINLPDGGKVVLETTYNSDGTYTEVAKNYDAQGNLVSSETIEPSVPVIESQNYAQTPNIETQEITALGRGDFGLGGGMEMMSMSPQTSSFYDEQFTYDNLGNRLSHNIGGFVLNSYTHNSLNQYTNILINYGGVNMSIEYDDNGNLKSDGGGYSYDYDYRNRLTSVNSGDVLFAYDSLGRRYKKTVGSTNTYYYFDTMGRVIAEKSGGSLQRSYVYGNQLDEALVMFLPEPAEEPHDANGSIALIGFCNAWLTTNSQYNFDNDANGFVDFKDYAVFASNWTGKLYSINTILPETEYYYLHDALGSVVGLIGGKYDREEDREYYLYDAYGTTSDSSAVGNPYKFQGKRYDGEIEKYYFLYRPYSPSLGRFMTCDPLGTIPNDIKPNQFSPQRQYMDGMNVYEFVRSSPTNFMDSFGLASCNLCNGGVWPVKIPVPVEKPPYIKWAIAAWASKTQTAESKCDACCELADKEFLKESGFVYYIFGHYERLKTCYIWCRTHDNAALYMN